MNGKPLDCIGTAGEVGKHDFQPAGPVVHAVGGLASERYFSEKITQLALTEQELRRVVRERDALARVLETIESGDLPDGSLASPNAQQFAAETLAKLERGELRKTGV